MRGMKTFLLLVPMLASANLCAATVGGSLALASDYVWRGTTQTSGDPAVQASVKLAGDAGFYASAWGSNVEFAPTLHASSEFDIVVGWAGPLSDDWALDVNLLDYRYPSTTADPNWTEVNGMLTFRNNYWAAIGWSNEVLGLDASGTYVSAGARFPLDDEFRFEAMAGWYDLGANDYAHAAIGAAWAFRAPFEARLTAHFTDHEAETFFGDEFAGNRIEVALQASF